jgi:signal transduction histidine kinase/iron only hydrogenase large subunit-like protein
MDFSDQKTLVSTIKERCRVCYTCVRECPAKAIRISSGQAEVIPERCIGCGNCIRVCSQSAKHVLSSIEGVHGLLDSGDRVAACIAPSFPAEFIDLDPRQLVGMVRSIGFRLVNQVAFGADLVAEQYRLLLSKNKYFHWIATTCPAIVEFVERYHPGLVPSLAPIVSPMVAMARVLRRLHGEDLRIVFIGPCIAKKAESGIDAVLTFQELRQMFERKGIGLSSVGWSDFDPPHGALGALFPVSHGMLQAAGISEDLLISDVVAADGKSKFVEAIKEFESGDMDVRLLEILCCNGCIMGPGINSPIPLFRRRSRVSQYARQHLATLDRSQWANDLNFFSDLNLERHFSAKDRRLLIPVEGVQGELIHILERMGKFSAQDELNCGACGYDTCQQHAMAIYRGLAESEMCLPYTIDQLRKTIRELAVSNEQLASVQEALVQSEKLASMGQLAAGIAHEVNNPLGIVLMYAHLLRDEFDQEPRLRGDLEMIVQQTDRCKKIVAGLLDFARQNKVIRHPVDVKTLIDQSLKVVPPPEKVAVQIRHETGDSVVEVDGDQITQVLMNLLSNAYAAMPEGGTLTILTSGNGATIRFTVTDTGIGISRENLTKIFEPFFTTKPLGRGTGLGLAVTYGIVKMHRGDIVVTSNADPAVAPTGTTFVVTLPRQGRQD